MTAEMAAKSAALGVALSGQASEMGIAWDDMLARLQTLQLQIDVTVGQARGVTACHGHPSDASRGGGVERGLHVAYTTCRRRKRSEDCGRETIGTSYGDAFKDAVKSLTSPGYMESDIKTAQDKLKGLVPEMFPT